MDAPPLLKYPRTPHLEGSRHGIDDDLAVVPFRDVVGRYVVVEEKLDGANCALRFNDAGEPFLQSRGHYLSGGPRERHFEQFKAWVSTHQRILLETLGSRYVLYGEWLGVKHTIFYDDLTHYFYEFDVYDNERGVFLDTASRRALLADTPVVSVPVLFAGVLFPDPRSVEPTLSSLVRPSFYKSFLWHEHLVQEAKAAGQDPDVVVVETDASDLAEGLYFKFEEHGETVARAKWVRPGFLHTLQELQGPRAHWLDRPHVANRLGGGVDIYSSELSDAMTRLRKGQVW